MNDLEFIRASMGRLPRASYCLSIVYLDDNIKNCSVCFFHIYMCVDICCRCRLAVRLEFVGTLIVMGAALFAVIARDSYISVVDPNNNSPGKKSTHSVLRWIVCAVFMQWEAIPSSHGEITSLCQRMIFSFCFVLFVHPSIAPSAKSIFTRFDLT